MEFTDKTIACKDCGAEFVFTSGEQEFYAEKGFKNEPSRCKECRNAKKGNSGQREYYDVECSACGANARVPFKPTGDKPVYCSECYKNR